MSWEPVGAVTAFVALGWAVYAANRTWRDSLDLRRAEFIRAYTNDYYSSPALSKLFLEIDYGRFDFDTRGLGTQDEVDLAHLLDFFNTLGMAVEHRVIHLSDLRKTTIGYAAMVTAQHPGVQFFLTHVDSTDAADQLGTQAFGYFRSLGELLREGALSGSQ